MYQVCTEKAEIASGKLLFLKVFISGNHEELSATIKFRPTSKQCTVRVLQKQKFWYFIEDDWHLFGRTSDISKNGEASILCEINFPLESINRYIAGVVLRDETGNYCIGHRGNIGGGVEGRGKTTFWKKYSGSTLMVEDGDQNCKVALVCGLGNPGADLQLASFLKQVSAIRDDETNK
jgi:hypothetical protein